MPSRVRNKIIFLTCLLFFVAGGFLVYRYWVMQKPFAVILFLSENFSPSTVSAARLFAGGADYRFKMESLPHLALASPRARDYAVADAAAAAIHDTGDSIGLSPAGPLAGSMLRSGSGSRAARRGAAMVRIGAATAAGRELVGGSTASRVF